MAQELGVSRTTIVGAYNELAAEGLVEAHVGRGTLVTGSPHGLGGAGPSAAPLAWAAHVTSLGKRLQEEVPADVAELGRLCNRPDVAQLCNGRPDSRLLPLDRIKEATEAAMRRAGVEAVSVGPKEGIATLREVVAARLARSGMVVETDHVVIVSGAQQGLDFLVRLLAEPGDTVMTEAPTYIGALDTFRAEGLRVVGVPVDRDGMDVDRAESAVARYRPRFIYTMPNYQNPTGALLSVKRREKLLNLAQRYQVPIIEDDPFGELYFDEPPPVTLRAQDDSGHVLYLGTVSKILAGGLRVGWLVAPRPIATLASRLKGLSDSQSASLSQHVLAEILERGWLDEHVTASKAVYAARCRAMDAALQRHLPRDATWSTPRGGMFTWVELPGQVAAQDLLSAAGPRGVVFLPGHLLYPAGGPANTCRLNFSAPDETEIERGVEVIGSTLRQMMRRRTQKSAEAAAIGPIA